MDRFPVTQIIVFAALAVVGISLAALATSLFAPGQVGVVVAVGAAMFGSALTFFLVEVFAWDRTRRVG